MDKSIKVILPRQKADTGRMGYTTDDTQNLGYCASGIKAIAHALWFYTEHNSDEEQEFKETVMNSCNVIEILAEPLQEFLFSGQPVSDPVEDGQHEST
jgi:hypothetical protein